jgi:hypothetical protein
MSGVELRVGGPIPRPHPFGWPVDQPAVVIAEHMHGIERHQRVHRSPGFERAARHVAEVDDIIDTLGANVGNDRFEREVISVHVGNGGKTHSISSYQDYPGGVPLADNT